MKIQRYLVISIRIIFRNTRNSRIPRDERLTIRAALRQPQNAADLYGQPAPQLRHETILCGLVTNGVVCEQIRASVFIPPGFIKFCPFIVISENLKQVGQRDFFRWSE